MKYNAKDITFLVGAGISKLAPSNIPLGFELTKYILEQSCGLEESQCIFKTWENFSNTIQSYNKKLKFPIPRLETILGCINELDNIMHRRTILYGLKSFKNVPFNHNHLILSHFFKNGSNILTTNFDLGIQNAYIKTYGQSLSHIQHETFSTYCGNSTGKIYHLHGSSKDDISLLGATVAQVKKGFDNKEKTIINNIIKNSKIIIVLGYSVSDSFDITPYFKDLKLNTDICCYIQHKNNDSHFEFPNNLDVILNGGKAKRKVAIDTLIFLTRFEAAILNKNEYYNNNNKIFDWKKEFEYCWRYKYSKSEKLINLLGIRYNIGFNTILLKNVNPNIFDEIKQYANTHSISNTRINSYISEALRSFDKLKKEQLIKPQSIVSDRPNSYIDKNYLILIRDECMYYILKYKKNAMINNTDKKRMLKLISLLEKYKDYSYSNVQYISYISAFCKYLTLLKAILNIGYSPSESMKELMISLDITYIEGAIAALTHYAEHCLILQKLNNYTIFSNEIKIALECAYKLSILSGYYYHCIIIKNIINDYNLNIEFN